MPSLNYCQLVFNIFCCFSGGIDNLLMNLSIYDDGKKLTKKQNTKKKKKKSAELEFTKILKIYLRFKINMGVPCWHNSALKSEHHS